MRQLLNILYVTKPKSYISKDGLNIVISEDSMELFRIPILNIEGIVTFGYMGISPGAMKLCIDNNVSICFLTPNGNFISRIQGKIKGNVYLRLFQFQKSENKTFALQLSKIFIGGKIKNYSNILKRFLRDNGNNASVSAIAKKLDMRVGELKIAHSFDQLRGIEGDAANSYFSVFNELILNKNSNFIFSHRSRRPPKDEINAMLSFIYTMIGNEITSALETVGLDPYIGFLHTLRPGRASLALDLIEEFRAYLGDRLVLSLINRKQISKKHFIRQCEENIIMTDEGRKILITAWQVRKKETIEHPFLKEKTPIGLLPYVQAMLLAKYLRDDLDNYPVFLMK